MNQFEQLKSIFLTLGFDIEKYKVDDYHYECRTYEDNYDMSMTTDKLNISAYHGIDFKLTLNNDFSIKKLEITSFP